MWVICRLGWCSGLRGGGRLRCSQGAHDDPDKDAEDGRILGQPCGCAALRPHGCGCVGLWVAVSPIVWALTRAPVGMKWKFARLLYGPLPYGHADAWSIPHLYLRRSLDREGGSGKRHNSPSSPHHGVAADEWPGLQGSRGRAGASRRLPEGHGQPQGGLHGPGSGWFRP